VCENACNGLRCHGVHLSAEACLLSGESLRIHQEIGDPRGVAICFKRLGDVAAALHRQEQAKGYYHESLALCEEFDHKQIRKPFSLPINCND